MRKLFLPIVFLLFFIFPFYPRSVVFASFAKFPNNPVLSNGSAGQFDSSLVGTPSVVQVGEDFIMFYEGHNGSNWFIGRAVSTNGTSWTKTGPINVSNPGEPNSHDPSVIFENGIYKMWYGNSQGNFFNMRINYATSDDGINWSTPQTVLTSSVPFDSNRGVSTPSVVHDFEGYKMWFAGNSNINGSDIWRIGFASSADGISWTKHPDPVLFGEGGWEAIGATSPSVLYFNGIYEIWYTSGDNVGHAWSIDGINWTKDPDNPILTKGSGVDFDNIHAGGNDVMRTNGEDLTWYTGINSGGKWQIGYASQPTELPPITPLPTLTPTITPTFTPSPTLTPNPTLTPTPHLGTNPVVLIPGMGASWNQKDIFSCDLSQSNTWTMAPYTDAYDRIINTFIQKAGLQMNQSFYVYPYDWRQTMDTSGQRLNEYINNLNLPNGKVDIVAHSLGGLVARSYITQNTNTHKVGRLVTIGTPHTGTALAYPLWENGELWVDNFVERIGINTLINYCRTKVSSPIATKRQVVQAVSPSIRDILPTYDFLRRNGQLVMNDLIEGENNWLKNNAFVYPFYNVSLLTISGIQKDTIETIDVKDPNTSDILFGNWKDGEPKKNNTVKLGDGSVLTSSSLLNQANNTTFNLNHINLVQNRQSIEQVLSFLGYSNISAFTEGRIAELTVDTSFTLTIDKPGTMALKTLKGQTLQTETQGILTYYDEKAAKYVLTVTPTEGGTYLLGYQQNTKKDSYWKDLRVTLKANIPKSFIINYIPKKPSELPVVAI